MPQREGGRARPPLGGGPVDVLGPIGMPLRDVLRGVSNLAAASGPAQLLPDPLRAGLHRAFESFAEAGTGLASPPVTQDDIRAAAAFVGGPRTDRAGAETCARILVHALDRLGRTRTESRLPLSETIAALRLHQAGRASGADRPGALLLAVRPPRALSGLAGQPGDEADLALVTVFVWLMAGRAGSLEGEERLLDLAFALTLALRDEVLSGPFDRGDVSRKLHNLSRDL